MKSAAKTVKDYLAGLPPDRREALSAIRKVILDHLPEGYEECMSYGMIGYVVPHRLYPKGYHCDPKLPLGFANLGSQKNYMVLHLMCVYGNAEMQAWFRKAWTDAGKKLDMGQACVRFKRIEDVPLEVVGQAVARVPVAKYIAAVEAALQMAKARRGNARPANAAK